MTDLVLVRDLVKPGEDFFLHELKLMQPGRCGDPNEEGSPLQRIGMGLGGDLRTDSPSP